ncbi:20247_t:CDS:1 [Funneliformis geosporum]|uniref:1203_t:CDS:1 n=1 Tax=Funneliformis geosporum TaxID=1117311 RepID=A0A9W4SHU0_9GLOM|nr:1203_t:CDS:1 [Funneliformis geosporum]CAI2183484.1 20247_t:CDS:1 [Funneliformis geosporum]
MKVAINQGILIYIGAMKQFRKFCSKTCLIIGFLICEILSLMIFNSDQLVGDFIQRSFYGTMIILGVIMQSSSAVYTITVIILCTQLSGRSDNNTKNVLNHTLSDFTNFINNEEAPGFSSMAIRKYLKKNNHFENNFAGVPGVPRRKDLDDVELGDAFEEKKQTVDIVVNKTVVHEVDVKLTA